MPSQTNGHTTRAAAPREKLTFPPDVPTFVTLEFDPPTEPRTGRSGHQYMYWFAGEKVAWLDPPVHARIVATGARAGDEICITRQSNQAWRVQRVDVEQEPARAPQPQAPLRPPADARPAAALASALIAAIDAAAVAERYAREQSLSIRFTAEDIRTMATTIVTRLERSL